MKVTINKCEYCGRLFEKKSDYDRHISEEEFVEKMEQKYSLPFKKEHNKKDCKFSNGEYCYVIPLKKYHKLVEEFKAEAIRIYPKLEGYEAKSIYFGRFLCDGDSALSGLRYHIDCICAVCGRIHGQPYYAINCNHENDAIFIFID